MIEKICIPRALSKRCLNVLLQTVEKDIADPGLQWELISVAIELNKELGCKADADRIAARSVIEDEPE